MYIPPINNDKLFELLEDFTQFLMDLSGNDSEQTSAVWDEAIAWYVGVIASRERAARIADDEDAVFTDLYETSSLTFEAPGDTFKIFAPADSDGTDNSEEPAFHLYAIRNLDDQDFEDLFELMTRVVGFDEDGRKKAA